MPTAVASVPFVPYLFTPSDANFSQALNADLTSISAAIGNSGTFVSVVTYGADPTGSADSTSAIQSAINAAQGGQVWFPAGKYNISASLNIGNGSASGVSTVSGVQLVGQGIPYLPFWSTYPNTGGVTLNWTGGSGAMISVNGPLQGWGINNMFLNGNNASGAGIAVSSGQFGNCNNLSITNCTAGIFSTTVPIGSFQNADSYFNTYRKVFIQVPDVMNGSGIRITGFNTFSDTDYNRFEDINISIPTPSSVFTSGIYMQICDSNTFDNVKIFMNSGNCDGVVFDYTAASSFPSSNLFYSVDVSGPLGAAWTNFGTPSGAFTNYIYGLITANGQVAPSISNLTVH